MPYCDCCGCGYASFLRQLGDVCRDLSAGLPEPGCPGLVRLTEYDDHTRRLQLRARIAEVAIRSARED